MRLFICDHCVQVAFVSWLQADINETKETQKYKLKVFCMVFILQTFFMASGHRGIQQLFVKLNRVYSKTVWNK